MKYYAKFELRMIDRENAVKGDELDRDVEEAINQIDIDGWEVNEDATDVQREVEVKATSKADALVHRIIAVQRINDGTDMPMYEKKGMTKQEAIEDYCNYILQQINKDFGVKIP